MANIHVQFKGQDLYVKPKSLLREFLQKFFLKSLSKIFPKQFLSYKNKIRFIINKSETHIHFYLAVMYLRLKFPFYYNLPSRQIYALHMALKFLKIMESQKIDFFLLEGSLLGAVRQQSFAGRPTDIDFGIREEHVQKLLDAIPLLIKGGARKIRKEVNNKISRVQILFPFILIDVPIYRKKIVKKKEMWFGDISKEIPEKINGITFPLNDLKKLKTISAYGKKFLAPSNPEKYLEKVYGKSWKVPIKKQFFWKNKFK